ncbi:MAG: fumarylacetoacetate hydrolase family protein [Burkholderiales bacterium]
MPEFDPGPAAQILAAAWRDDTQMDALPADVRPGSLREGYDVQDLVSAQLGDPTVGWKLGLGSADAMRRSGLGHPLIGRVTASRCFVPGDVVELRTRAPVTIEFEIAFRLARDIPPGAVPSAPITAVETIHLTCEVVRARYVDRRAVGWPSFVADDAGFRALVVGPSISASQAQGLAASIIVDVDGKEKVRGARGGDRTDPVGSLAALLAHAGERGITLRRGDIVSTGAASVPFDLDRSAQILARAEGVELGFRLAMRE